MSSNEWNDAPEIIKAAGVLAETLKNSRLYKAYRKSRIKLERHPDVALQLRLFKQKHMEYEQQCMAVGAKPSFDEEKGISHQYAELTRNPAAAEFLARENALLDTYGQVINLIDEVWDIDLFN